MFFREAKSQDIEKMHAVRMSVEENPLSPPQPIGPEDYQRLLEGNGKGWVCEVGGDLLGFALVDVGQARVWALSVRPGLEDHFIRRMLHDMMTSWCFARGLPKLTLSTAPNTRAEQFYRKAGWLDVGAAPNGEISFELENNLEPRDF
jgi:ribosomal protein S18 acetylase RimI-like enzyme